MLLLQELSATEVSNLLWAAAVLVPDMEPLFARLQSRLSDLPASGYGQDQLAQILQVRPSSSFLHPIDCLHNTSCYGC